MLNDSLVKFKEQLLESGIFLHMNTVQYTCQCPFCQDNNKHCYVRIDPSDDSPVEYHCFKCLAGGWVGRKFLEFFGLDETIPFPRFKNSSGKRIKKTGVTSVITVGDTVDEKHDTYHVREYIESRVGHYPTLDELKMFQYIGYPRGYATDYLGYKGEGRPFTNRYWFRMTNGNIIGRWKDDKKDTIRWLKFKTQYNLGPGIYTMRQGFDPYKELNVCIAEGIMDVIGLYYNYPIENALYVAVLGKQYSNGIQHIISRGLFGASVNVRIFKDPNVDTSTINVDPISKQLFKRVEIYENVLGYDYGIPPDKLEVKKVINSRY